MDNQINRRGFFKLSGAALTLPALATIGIQPESPIIVAHRMPDAVPAKVIQDWTDRPIMNIALADITPDDQPLTGIIGPMRFALTEFGTSLDRGATMRWVASPGEEIILPPGPSAISLVLERTADNRVRLRLSKTVEARS